MDAIRKIGSARFAATAALIGAAAYVAPSIWATDRMVFGLVSFDQLTFVLSLALAYPALGVNEAGMRTKLALGVIAAFALATVLLLGFSIGSVGLLVAALAFGALELPREEPEAQPYGSDGTPRTAARITPYGCLAGGASGCRRGAPAPSHSGAGAPSRLLHRALMLRRRQIVGLPSRSAHGRSAT
jgi:hypothetical protein